MRTRPEPVRVSRLRRLMDEKGIGSLLVTQRENVRYLTGFTGSSGIAVVTPERLSLITDFRYKLQARQETRGITIVIQKADWAAALKDVAGRGRIKTLWFDESSVTVERLKKLRTLGVGLRGRKDPVAELRRTKDDRELASIRTAVRRAEESFLELRKHIKPGVTERSLALRLEYLMREKGARRAAFDLIVASGRNGAMPHASVTDRRIKKGDLVTIDFGAEADGYFSDITRTVCVGPPTSRQREVHDLVYRAQQAAMQRVRPGVLCNAIDEAARELITKAGHGGHFGHATGHGIGLMVHEGPTLSRLSKDRVQEGMVFTIEPGVYVPVWGGVRIEDMVLATGTGFQSLTSLPGEL